MTYILLHAPAYLTLAIHPIIHAYRHACRLRPAPLAMEHNHPPPPGVWQGDPMPATGEG